MDEAQFPARSGSATRICSVAATVSVAVFCAACTGGAGSAARQDTQRISPNDFASGEPAREPAPESAQTAPEQPPRVISAQEARGGDPDVLTLVGRPADLRLEGVPPSPDQPGDPNADPAGESVQTSDGSGSAALGDPDLRDGIVIDEMVGQINGRPVYAAAFLEPLDDFLSAEAIEQSRGEWIQSAGELIQNQLLERIRDELLIAEFNAELSYEERIGLFAFIDQIQQGIVDRDLGSAARADERLQTMENVSLRGKAQEQFNREIVFEQLRREVNRKVQVSWRDIRRYYDQNITIFQPPSSARLRVLRVNQSAQDRVEQMLADRSNIIETIGRETDFRSAEGGLIELELGAQGLEAAEFFGPPELNDPATRLERGELSEPIVFGGSVWWLYLEDIVQPEAVSLYDAQNRIEQAIRSEREQEERARYFERLFGSSTMTEQQLGEMRDRLIRFAIDRYLGPQEPSGSG